MNVVNNSSDIGGAPYPTEHGQQPEYPQQGAPYPPEYGQQPGYPQQGAPYPSEYPQQGAPYPPEYRQKSGYPQQDSLQQTFSGDNIQETYETIANFASSSFSDKAIRKRFIAKVYAILSSQLAITMIFILVFLLVEKIKNWVQSHQWVYWIAYCVFACIYIALVCCSHVRRKYPGNFIALTIFTLSFSYLTATITSFYDINSIAVCIAITTGVCIIISIVAIVCPIDLTKCYILIFALSIFILIFGVVVGVVFAVSGRSKGLQALYGAAAALLFCLYLAYDTQMIIGGRDHEMSPEDYIFGALELYLDIINLFLHILALFGSSNK